MTAVEFIVEQLAKNGVLHSSDIARAKEMEKEQMMQCYEDGYNRVAKLIENATQRNLNL